MSIILKIEKQFLYSMKKALRMKKNDQVLQAIIKKV